MIPTIYLCAFLALMCLSVRGQINGPDGYDPFLNTQDNWHVLQTIGNKDAYEITASNYQGSKASTATCMNVVSMSEGLGYEQSSLFTGPCQTSTRDHQQILHVQCIIPDSPKRKATGMATIIFRDNFNAQILTAGFIRAGFMGEGEGDVLRRGNLSGHQDRIGVTVHCPPEHEDE